MKALILMNFVSTPLVSIEPRIDAKNFFVVLFVNGALFFQSLGILILPKTKWNLHSVRQPLFLSILRHGAARFFRLNSIKSYNNDHIQLVPNAEHKCSHNHKIMCCACEQCWVFFTTDSNCRVHVCVMCTQRYDAI